LYLIPRIIRSDYLTTISLGSRLLIWQAYYKAWLTSPLLGLGPGNAYQAARFLSPYGEEYIAHSNYLYLAADFGALGLLAAFWLFAHTLRHAWRYLVTLSLQDPLVLGAGASVVALA